MSSLQDRERALYDEAWALDGYADFAPGVRYLSAFLSMTEGLRAPHDRVLDAGTGSGKGAVALLDAGFRVTCCDITPAGLVDDARALPFVPAVLWHDLSDSGIPPHDWAYCTDVLEHIPTEMVGLVLSRLLDAADKGVFLSISLVPDQFGAMLGQPLHLTVRPFVWWRDLLRELGDLVEARDLGNVGLYLVRRV